MRRSIPTVMLALVALTACEERPQSATLGPAARPAAALLAPRPDTDLDEQLRIMDAELAAAQEGEPLRVMTAEAVSDQLLHAPRDVDWLATGYSLEARVRQIQAMADGIVARLRRGATLGGVDEDIRLLRAAIADLRRQLNTPGGGPAPLTLETLLAQDPLRDARARPASARPAAADTPTPQEGQPADPPPAQPAPVGRPLGSPIPDGL